jgi:Flp pilus assembly pilin Flp
MKWASLIGRLGGMLIPGGRWRAPRQSRAGVVGAEYALLLAVLVVAGIVAWYGLAQSLKGALADIANTFTQP